MKKKIFIVLLSFVSIFSYSQESCKTIYEKTDSLQNEITLLKEKVKQLESKIESEILENGYSVIVKKKYSYSPLKLVDQEYGTNAIDTIQPGDSIKIIDKTTSYFKIVYNDKTGYIYTNEIDITEYPALNFLNPSYLRTSIKSNSNYSTSSSSGGNVSVKGYYRKDGTYVKPHTRKSPSRRK